MQILQRFLPVFVLAVSTAVAAPIVPVSYSYPSGGPYAYTDSTGEELTDGAYNAVIPGLNLGTPNADNWVGFQNTDAEMLFNFDESVTIDSVTLSMAYWTRAGVYLPTTVSIGGTTFAVDAADYVNLDKALLTFNGGWTGDSLSVSVTRGGEWTFFDEVSFTTGAAQPPVNPVPDAGSTVACLAMALVAGCFTRRRFAAKRADEPELPVEVDQCGR